MEAQLQRRIQRSGWDRAAAQYEQSWQSQLGPAHVTTVLHAKLQAGDRVLDVACGTGLVTLAAAMDVRSTGSVVGVDLSNSMIGIARVRAFERGLRNVRFERMDAESLALPSAYFDAALCSLGLMYVPDVEQAVSEMVRVVKPGGRVVASVWGPRDRCGWAELFAIVDARVRSEVCPMFFSLGTADRLGSIFRRAGLRGVTTDALRAHLDWRSGDEACGAAFIGGPVALAYSRFDDETRCAVRREYLQSIEPWRRGDGYAVPGEFVIVAGRTA